ncbi:MAG TPA: PKD domain-containing protein [Myxococcaceae bacterium]|nr:PKD domain-containing protein [Myxococcaceae bacterium]
MSGRALPPLSILRQLVTASALLACAARAAAPAITSSPNLTTQLNEPYQYDADGRADATGTAPLDWSLAAAPAGMEIDNLTGEIFWFADATGDFPVDLAAANGEGTDHQRFTIHVAGPNPPLLSPVQATQIAAGQPLFLQLVASGAQPIAWRLDSGPAGALLDPVTGILTWLPAATGTFTFTFTAANAAGEDSGSWTVDVVSVSLPVPTAAFSATPASGEAPLVTKLDSSASRSNDPGSSRLFDEWDPGDGSPTRSGLDLTTLLHGYPAPGGYQVHLTVRNASLNAAGTSGPVLVTSGGLAPPQARIAMDVSSGPAPLTVTFHCDCQAGSSPIVSYAWDFGDGSGSTRADASHAYAQPGGYTVKLRVLDQRGLVARDAAPVAASQGGKLPPFARARALPVSGDAPFTSQLVSEFGDPDGVVVSRRWTVPDGRSANDADPSWRFDAVGSFQARLEVTDNDGLTASDTVEIQVTKNGVLPPKIVSTPVAVGSVGVPYVYAVDGHATAIGGLPVTWEVGKAAAGGRVNAPAGMQIDPATGLVTWTPRKDQVGDVAVSLTASNAAGSDVQDFTVTVVDRSGYYWIGCAAVPGSSLAFAAALVAAAMMSRRRRRG